MGLRTIVIILGCGFAAMLTAHAVQESAELPATAWVHEGDSDGDGLSDAFEVAHGLDPLKAGSLPDGMPDEERLDSNGKTMWETQKVEVDAAQTTGWNASGGGGACGATGMETILALGLLAVLRVWRR